MNIPAYLWAIVILTLVFIAGGYFASWLDSQAIRNENKKEIQDAIRKLPSDRVILIKVKDKKEKSFSVEDTGKLEIQFIAPNDDKLTELGLEPNVDYSEIGKLIISTTRSNSKYLPKIIPYCEIFDGESVVYVADLA